MRIPAMAVTVSMSGLSSEAPARVSAVAVY
jgi:hypothetical protein